MAVQRVSLRQRVVLSAAKHLLIGGGKQILRCAQDDVPACAWHAHAGTSLDRHARLGACVAQPRQRTGQLPDPGSPTEPTQPTWNVLKAPRLPNRSWLGHVVIELAAAFMIWAIWDQEKGDR